MTFMRLNWIWAWSRSRGRMAACAASFLSSSPCSNASLSESFTAAIQAFCSLMLPAYRVIVRVGV